MDVVTIIILVIAGVGIVFFSAFLLGFRINPRITSPEIRVGEPVEKRIIVGLPRLLSDYVESCHSSKDAPVPSTVVAWGVGKLVSSHMPILGDLWSPFTFSIFLSPGLHYVWKSNVTWFQRSFIRGGDQYRNGKGLFLMGKTRLENPNLNDSLHTMMWIYTLLFAPSTLIGRENVSYQQIDDESLQVTIADKDFRPKDFVLRFDPQTGELVRIETDRTMSKGGTLPFSVNFKNPLVFEEQIALPGSVELMWESEIYSKFNVTGVRYGVDIRKELDEGI